AVLGRLAIRLRAGRYDTAIVLHRSFGALRRLAALSGASTVVAAAPINGVESSRDENRRALSMLGIDDDGGPLEIWTTDADRDSAARLTAEAPGSGPLVGLHPGSDWSCQQWLPERLAAVGSRLQVEVGARLLITGAAGEAALAAEVAEGLRGGAVNAAGRTSLAELVAVIQRLDLLVCVNSAPAAIARAVDTRAVVLLGPEDPRLTGLEEGPGLRVVQPGRRPAPGSWCEFGRWGLLSGCESPMCRGLNGLGELDPGAVVAEAVELLARGPLAPRRTALGA
ncbi:MAG: hypothetical protein J2P45_27040, partial [Candidatus Dormibacteraeota bacterium]|nr:hypothetical protein [Candidatus Dormibacteraeota bacterium]